MKASATWLATLKDSRYSYRSGSPEAKPDEHALHYAANTLLGLIDYNFSDKEKIDAVVAAFSKSTSQDSSGFVREWMRYRNIDRIEVVQYILFAFLNYCLHGLHLSRDSENLLDKAAESLKNELRDSADDANYVWSSYTARRESARASSSPYSQPQ